jgi:hypothetical protein
MARSMPVAPGWVTAVLGKQFGTATFKTIVTQALFRPINVFLFLFLQAAFRGDSARKLVDGIRAKFRSSVIGGVAFYSVSNLLMYSVPVPFLHPIMGSVAGSTAPPVEFAAAVRAISLSPSAAPWRVLATHRFDIQRVARDRRLRQVSSPHARTGSRAALSSFSISACSTPTAEVPNKRTYTSGQRCCTHCTSFVETHIACVRLSSPPAPLSLGDADWIRHSRVTVSPPMVWRPEST